MTEEDVQRAIEDIEVQLASVRRADEERKALLLAIFKRALRLCEGKRYDELLALLKQMADGYEEQVRG